jgi:hypothetical protein
VRSPSHGITRETAAEIQRAAVAHGIAVVGVSLDSVHVVEESIIRGEWRFPDFGADIARFYLYGYTLNRITLFALIFSIGILVDDAIVVVENIVGISACGE